MLELGARKLGHREVGAVQYGTVQYGTDTVRSLGTLTLDRFESGPPIKDRRDWPYSEAGRISKETDTLIIMGLFRVIRVFSLGKNVRDCL